MTEMRSASERMIAIGLLNDNDHTVYVCPAWPQGAVE